MMRVEVLGVDLAIARMVALQAATTKAAEVGAAAGAEAVLQAAAALVPVDTGNLRDSLGVTRDDDGGALVGTTVDYAPFVEFGTSVMAAEPFLRPAADSATDEVTRAVDTALQVAIRSVAGL